MKKEYLIIFIFLLSKFALIGQDEIVSLYNERSISLFEEIIHRDTNSDSYYLYKIGYNPIRYELDGLNCLSLIFTEEGNFHYIDHCPSDYGTYGNIGTYQKKGDTIFFKTNFQKIPSFFPKHFGIRNGCIKEIFHQNLSKDTLSEIIIEENGLPFSFKGRILYYKNYKFLKSRTRSMGLNSNRKSDEQTIDKLFITSLLISKYPEKNSEEIFLKIMQKWRMRGKKIIIQLWDKPLKIIRTNGIPFLYKWNWRKSKYEKICKLIHEFEEED